DAGSRREQCEQRRLTLRQFHRSTSGTTYSPAGDVQRTAWDGQVAGVIEMTPQQRPNSCQQLGELERFGQIVLGSGVQTVDPVAGAATSRQDEDRRADAPAAQPRDQGQPLDRAQATIDA